MCAEICHFLRFFTPLSPSYVDPPHTPVCLERNKWFFFDKGRIWDSERTQSKEMVHSGHGSPEPFGASTLPPQSQHSHREISPVITLSAQFLCKPLEGLEPVSHLLLGTCLTPMCNELAGELALETERWANRSFTLYGDLGSSAAMSAISWPSSLVSAEWA